MMESLVQGHTTTKAYATISKPQKTEPKNFFKNYRKL